MKRNWGALVAWVFKVPTMNPNVPSLNASKNICCSRFPSLSLHFLSSPYCRLSNKAIKRPNNTKEDAEQVSLFITYLVINSTIQIFALKISS